MTWKTLKAAFHCSLYGKTDYYASRRLLFLLRLPWVANNSIAGRPAQWGRTTLFILAIPATSRTTSEVSAWQTMLHAIVCMPLILGNPYILKNIEEKSMNIDTETTSPSEFSLFVKNYLKDLARRTKEACCWNFLR